jgi:uncharacterized membrane protein
MTPARMEAFTDGVVAIIITIMVLELPVPKAPTPQAVLATAPIFLAYALSYVNVGIYWANHHHLLHMTERIDGRVLWANLFMLFWLSLVPLIIRWLDEAGFVAPWLAILLYVAVSAMWLVPDRRIEDYLDRTGAR